MKKKKKTEKKPFIKTRTRMDNSIEVELQKSPAKTVMGKLLLFFVVIGTVVLPVAVLIYVMIEMANK